MVHLNHLGKKNTFDDPRPYWEVGINALTTPWYLSRVHNFDTNLDGRKDIVFWNEDHFDAYLQDENGLFTNDPTSFNTDVPFDTDGVYSIVFGYTNSNMFSLVTGLRKSSTHTVIHSIQDLNNDGLADLVTLSLSGRSVLKQKSQYNIYFGHVSDAGIQFSTDEVASVFPNGASGGAASGGYSYQWFEDFNGDGQVDILRYDVQMGLGSIFKALFSSYILIDVEAFGMDEKIYAESPNFSHTLKVVFDVKSDDGGFFPTFFTGDLNGDDKTDFILGIRRNNLDIYWGSDGTELINPEPEIINVEIPQIENRAWTHDFNMDGKDDILMYYENLDTPRKLKVVMSK